MKAIKTYLEVLGMGSVSLELLTLLVAVIACYIIYLVKKRTNFTFVSVLALVIGILDQEYIFYEVLVGVKEYRG